ncbi:MAG: helix-turn-helix transcriptional regulator [Lachnospiraceae bacterium]|nr:helix-turn-helix transcriptional regulator [Lachnospiraceae bacterium]
MIDRLKQIRKTLKINQTKFAKELGLTQTAYSMIENGHNPLSNRHIKIICSTFNVNEIWLRTGEGEMFNSSPYEKEFTTIFGHLTPETQKYLLLMAKELLNTQQKLLKPQNIKNIAEAGFNYGKEKGEKAAEKIINSKSKNINNTENT